MRTRSPLLLIVLLLSGCTHTSLRLNANRQAATLTDILFQQTLDNIAMFEANPDTLPHFATVGDGTTQLQDQAQGVGSFTWNPYTIVSEALNVNASRTLVENWKLQPVMTPGRLLRLRCAFQLAIAPSQVFIVPASASPPAFRVAMNDPDDCSVCMAELVKMQLVPAPPQNATTTDEKTGHAFFAIQANAEAYAGIVQNALASQLPSCWFGHGCRKDVPREACYVGCYGNSYVWVTRDGIDALSRFTATLLVLATQDPPAGSRVTIKRTVNIDGKTVEVTGDVTGTVLGKKEIEELKKQLGNQLLAFSSLEKQTLGELPGLIERIQNLEVKEKEAFRAPLNNLSKHVPEAPPDDISSPLVKHASALVAGGEADLTELETELKERAARLATIRSSLDQLKTIRIIGLDQSHFESLDAPSRLAGIVLKQAQGTLRELQAIHDQTSRVIQRVEPGPFDRPGNMPFSRSAGGIEFMPSVSIP